MKHLLNLQDHNGKAVVSARELYEFVESKAQFTDWCKRMFEYGFEEHSDFITILGKSSGGRPSVDYGLTIDCAKEISMLQRSEKGKEARQYFIECEKRMRDREVLASGVSDDQIILRAVTMLQERVETQAKQLELANNTIQEQAPKVKYTEEVLNSDSLITVNAIAKELGMSAISLNHKLQELKIQYRQGGLWLLYAQYQNKGYTKTKTYTYYDTSGKQQTSMQTYWTEKGRAFIHSKVNQVFNLPRKHSLGERRIN